MDYIYRLEIELDDDKIISEGIYDIDSIYNVIRECFKCEEIPEVENDEHTLTFASNRTDKDDFAGFGLVETTLVEEDWFMRYVKKMTWYEKYDDGISVEDVLEVFKEDGLI